MESKTSILESNDKVAILIIAHKNINQLTKLINSIYNQNIDVFIHLDKKWALSNAEIEHLLKLRNNKKSRIYICDERYSISLFSWNMVAATIELISTAKRNEEKQCFSYKYYVLLSGQDYPIKKISYIYDQLIESYPKPFIDCTPISKGNWVYNSFYSSCTEKKINKKINSILGRGLIRKIIKLPFYITFKIIKKINSTYHKLDRLGCKMYGGSQWWILPDKVISFIMKYIENGSRKELELLKCPLSIDETFFQTIAMKSQFKSKIEVNHKDMVAQNCKTYAHFSDENKPFKGHPYILTIEDYDMICNLDHFFVRKLDLDVDSKIFEMIDKNLLS